MKSNSHLHPNGVLVVLYVKARAAPSFVCKQEEH